MDYLILNMPTDRGILRQDRRAGSEEVFPDFQGIVLEFGQGRTAEGCSCSLISPSLPPRFSYI